jgi:quinol monooxygenase YgiN
LSITVLSELRPHVDPVDAVIQRSIEQLSLPSGDVAGRRIARLYQHVDDPAWLLYLADWDSREAFEAYRQTAPMAGSPDQLQQVPSLRFYRRLALFERVLTPVSIIGVAVVDGPAGTHASRRDLALAYHRSGGRDRPGLVLLQVHEAVDAVPGLLLISGWETIEQLQQADQAAGRALLDQLAANGGTHRRFVGRALAEATGA